MLWLVASVGPFEVLQVLTMRRQVVMKIVRHARQSASAQPSSAGSSSTCTGQLLGLDLSGVLNVSDCYGFPANHVLPVSDGSDDRDFKRRDDTFDVAANNAASFTAQYLPRLAECNADANVVGFYATTNNGQLVGSNGGLIEALARYQLGPAAAQDAASTKTRSRSSASDKRGPGRGVALVYGQFRTHSRSRYTLIDDHEQMQAAATAAPSTFALLGSLTLSLPFSNLASMMPPGQSLASFFAAQSLTASFLASLSIPFFLQTFSKSTQ